MKKYISIILVSAIVLGLAACGKKAATTEETATTDTATEATATTEPAAETSSEPSGTLVVYSPHDADPLNSGINMFMEKYPDIQVEVVAAGTGELCNRIAAEAANPICDVLWGGGADSLAAFTDYFAPYVCANDDVIAEEYKDANDLWIGESPLPMVIFYNKTLIEKDGLTAPTSWSDLIKPEWKGKIAYASPAKSGSAYTQLCTMLLGHGGKEAGWDFINQLYDNLDGKILDSSGKCHKMVADGEYYVGLTLEKSAIQYAADTNVGFVYPADGTSAVPDGVALVKGAPNEENAKLFIDFVTSEECQKAQNEQWGRRPVRSDMVVKDLISLSDLTLVDYDFAWAATEKEAIIEKFNDMMVE